MFTVQTLNSISSKGLERLPGSMFQVEDEMESPDAVLVRSANMLESALPASLLAIARAGAGVNNIPVANCTERGVVVFNTPGANANAVKELVLGALVLASRKITDGVFWVGSLADKGDEVAKLVEKGKSKFAGPELANKTLGVVGLGAIGAKVANMGTHLYMDVLGYDPFISVEGAWSLSRSVQHCVNLADIITGADYITLHLPVTKETRGFINATTIAQMKPGVRIVNFARGELVDNAAILEGLKSGRIGAYVTDFPTADLINKPGVICIPHLGASTPESEENCAVMAADQLQEYLLNGNISNSVNLPSVCVPRLAGSRVCVIHKNAKGLLAGLTDVLNRAGHNIENMTNKSRDEYAYTLMDMADMPNDATIKELASIEGIVRVRVI